MMSWFSGSRILLFCCSALMISGCINLAGENPRKDSYLLNVSRANGAPIEVQPAQAILQIRKFRVSPRYDDNELVYRMDENTYVADYYNRFFVAPAVVVSEEVGKWMQSARLFEVLEGPSRVEPDYLLEGNVPALYGDFTQSTPLAVMEIEFTLLRELPSGPELLLKKSYRREIPLSEKSPGALINGFDEALTTILTTFEKDLRNMDLTPVH